ncbi:hypothetical protein P8T65_10570 [Streptomyces sp. 11x1]|nr:hypothetical protein [Streptomyces sp. 11x1]WNZ07986.1 hypothetical protein P8T65_10570 [Streptomyces sp. 11x1]
MRGATTRTVLSALAAVLLTLAFFAPTTSFAAAHTPGHAKAKAEPGNTPTAKPLRDTAATHRTCAPSQDPTGPHRTRDRHRLTTHTVPETPARPPLGENPAAASSPERPSAPHHRASRPLTAHTPAALQVFRC